ncbi:nucleoside hydrolase [Aquamicrobium sp. LC103]|uniref:nucleoside hydrolase n=1 Tax=Aquamicrobium sp. LC103 TaxID=1120658 RepID=UPI00063EB4D9|nr:nucleoside hydrolase [Aquamicrobium sp. LC103]TKT78349.1 nucleoside hydrolase [Aquamicrobium sp. LC103]
MTKVLIDCDPGHDDATAILYAARHLELVGISTVYGNQSVDKTTTNALSLSDLLGLDVPVARGCEQPLIRTFRHGGDVHGKTGIDGAELPVPSRQAVDAHAVDFIIEMAGRYRDELVLCPIGPFTNVALALRKEPRLAKWLRGISCMGGTTQIGNTTPVAEFNIWCDPEAADIVFRSGVPMWMVGLNVTRQVGITEDDIARLNAGNAVARTYGGLFTFFRQRLNEIHGLTTASLHDPCALVPFIDPELITYANCPVEVELGDGITRGMTVCDFRNLTSAKLENIRSRSSNNCHVAVGVEARALVDHIMNAILAWPDRSSAKREAATH